MKKASDISTAVFARKLNHNGRLRVFLLKLKTSTYPMAALIKKMTISLKNIDLKSRYSKNKYLLWISRKLYLTIVYDVSTIVQITAITKLSLYLYLFTAENLPAIDLNNFMQTFHKIYKGIDAELGVPPLAVFNKTARLNAMTDTMIPIINTLYAMRINRYLRPRTTPK